MGGRGNGSAADRSVDRYRPGRGEFADLLRAQRQQAQLTQEELAARSGLSTRCIRDLERGRTQARPHTIKLLTEGLGLLGDTATALREAADRQADCPPAAHSHHPDRGQPDRQRPRRSHDPDPAQPDRQRPRRSHDPDRSAPAASLIGRDTEVRAIARALDCGPHRLISVCGLGGVGKTSVVQEVVSRLHDQRGWPVVWVPADENGHQSNGHQSNGHQSNGHQSNGQQENGRHPAMPHPSWQPLSRHHPTGLSCDIKELLAAPAPAPVRLCRRIGRQDMVVVLDGITDLPARTRDTVSNLLYRCPWLRIIATSRAPLPVTDHTVALAPLPVPPDQPQPRTALSRVTSVRLLVERIRETHPRWRLAAADAPAVATLCRRLDGLPLALELAADQTLTTSLQELATVPATGLLALATSHPPATIGGLIGESYRLLDEPDCSGLQTLATHVEPWSIEEAASALGRTRTETVDTLVTLAQMGMVRRHRHERATSFQVLHLVRAFLQEQEHQPPAAYYPSAPYGDRLTATARLG